MVGILDVVVYLSIEIHCLLRAIAQVQEVDNEDGGQEHHGQDKQRHAPLGVAAGAGRICWFFQLAFEVVFPKGVELGEALIQRYLEHSTVYSQFYSSV